MLAELAVLNRADVPVTLTIACAAKPGKSVQPAEMRSTCVVLKARVGGAAPASSDDPTEQSTCFRFVVGWQELRKLWQLSLIVC